jgi:methylmalonyl-CoA/ethylmalonyl-CoA epimerase
VEVKRIDHLALCVRDMDAAIRTMEAMGAVLQFRRRNDTTELESATFTWGNITVTLEHPLSDRGPFAEFLRRHGEGLHHIGMDVENIAETIADLNGREMRTVNHQLGGDVRHEALLHPKSGLGILWQLMEWQGQYKDDLPARLDASREGKVEIPGATRPL